MNIGSVILGGSLDTDIPEIDVQVTEGPKRSEVKSLIEDYFENMNTRDENIATYIQSSYFDNVVQGFSLWRYLYDRDLEFGFDASRIDPRTIRFVEETSKGYIWIIQHASELVMKEKDFFSTLPWYGAVRSGTMVWMKYDRNYFNFTRLFPYQDPPSVPLMPIILHKMALIYYIHLSANTNIKPNRIVKIGDVKSNIMPKNTTQWEHDFAQAERILTENINGDYIFPGYWDMVVEQANRAKMDDLVKELNYYDELIGIGVGMPLGLLRQTGVRLSTDNVLQSVWLQRIQSFRRSYRSSLKSIIEHGLLPANGYKRNKIKLNLPPLSADSALTKAQAALTIAQAGLWETGAEGRKWLSTSFESMSDSGKQVPYDMGQIAGLAPRVDTENSEEEPEDLESESSVDPNDNRNNS